MFLRVLNTAIEFKKWWFSPPVLYVPRYTNSKIPCFPIWINITKNMRTISVLFLLVLCVCVCERLKMYLCGLFSEALREAICFSISPRQSRDF